MLERAHAERLAAHWIAAWNAHDLDAIMSHYADDVEIASPVVAQLLGAPDGRVSGKRLAESFDAIRYREDKAEVCATLRERYPADREVTTICGAKPPVQADTARRNTL